MSETWKDHDAEIERLLSENERLRERLAHAEDFNRRFVEERDEFGVWLQKRGWRVSGEPCWLAARRYIEYLEATKGDVAELEARVGELCFVLWWGCPKAEKEPEYRMPISSDEVEACEELERLGKLERHATKPWWKEKGDA